jgi:hypothetical protein
MAPDGPDPFGLDAEEANTWGRLSTAIQTYDLVPLNWIPLGATQILNGILDIGGFVFASADVLVSEASLSRRIAAGMNVLVFNPASSVASYFLGPRLAFVLESASFELNVWLLSGQGNPFSGWPYFAAVRRDTCANSVPRPHGSSQDSRLLGGGRSEVVRPVLGAGG